MKRSRPLSTSALSPDCSVMSLFMLMSVFLSDVDRQPSLCPSARSHFAQQTERLHSSSQAFNLGQKSKFSKDIECPIGFGHTMRSIFVRAVASTYLIVLPPLLPCCFTGPHLLVALTLLLTGSLYFTSPPYSSPFTDPPLTDLLLLILPYCSFCTCLSFTGSPNIGPLLALSLLLPFTHPPYCSIPLSGHPFA